MPETNENAVPRREYGGFWLRVLAFFIDGWLLQLITFPILFGVYIVGIIPIIAIAIAAGAGKGQHGSPGALSIALILALSAAFVVFILLLVMAIYGLYAGILLSRYGTTPGKMILNMKVVDAETGGNPSFWKAFLRECVKILGILPIYLGCVIAAFDSEKRALQDRVCGTRVVKTPPRRKAPGA